MEKTLINVADLRALIDANTDVEAFASEIDGVEGYLLMVKTNDISCEAQPDNGSCIKSRMLDRNEWTKEFILSTYLSSKPRLFKRSDALLNEARDLGLKSVKFEFLPK
jgi:hypothetical protein